MNILDVGRRGLGKSTLAQFQARKLNKNIVVFDTNNQFKNAFVRTSDLDELESTLDSDEENGIYVAYVPTAEVELEWDRFAARIWNYGDYSLIIDEAHRIQKPQYVNPWLDRFMRQAPRRERDDENPIDIIQTFHRPVDVNGIVLSLSDFVYFFRISKRRDLDWIENEWATKEGDQLVDVVQQLRTPQTSGGDKSARDVVKVEVETGAFEVITDSNSWFVNIRQQQQNSATELTKKNLENAYGKF